MKRLEVTLELRDGMMKKVQASWNTKEATDLSEKFGMSINRDILTVLFAQITDHIINRDIDIAEIKAIWFDEV